MITEQEIENAAHRYAFSFDGEYQEGYNKRQESFVAGVNYANGVVLERLKDPSIPEWTEVDLDDIQTFPLEFDPVICINEYNEYQILQLLRYGPDIDDYNWETQGLKRNTSFPIDFVKRWINLPEPPKQP